MIDLEDISKIKVISTAKKDKAVKKKLYEQFGAKEYWLIEPYVETVDVFLLEDEKYGAAQVYGREDEIVVHVLEDLKIDLENFSRGGSQESRLPFIFTNSMEKVGIINDYFASFPLSPLGFL